MDEFLRDRKGRIVGEMKTEGKKTFLYGDHGQILGWYDGTFTYNEHGGLVGMGNLLGTLVR
jgi:hypothetical protein